MGRLGEVVIVLSLLQATTLAQSLLLRAPADGPLPEVRFDSPTGTATAATQPTTLSPTITVLIDAPLLSTSALRASLARLLVPNKHMVLELVALLPTEARSVTASTRLQLNAAIRNLASLAGPDAPSATFAALLGGLRSLPTEQWKQVIYIGPEPAIAPDLRDYAYGLLLRTAANGRIRLSHVYPAGAGEPAWAPQLIAFGGGVSAEGPSSLLQTADTTWLEANLPAGGPAEGFRVLPLHFRVGRDEPRTLPWIWSAPATSLPDLPEYEEFLARRARILHTTPTAADFAALLAVNPSDLDTLKLAADAADRAHDTASAIRYTDRIVELEPDDGPYWARLGISYWQTGDPDNAERCLLRARNLGADPFQSAAILGDIRSRKADYSGAVEHYREALRREPDRLELWLKLSDGERRLKRRPEAAQALEEALKRKSDLWPRRIQLIDYYLETADMGAAKRHLAAGIPLLPPDTSLVIRFAVYSERLGLLQDANRLWTRVIALDPSNELGHYSLARLYESTGTWDKALAAAENGLRVAPRSVRLVALQADALVALGRVEDARRVLRSAAGPLPDADLLRRAADLEDRYGSDSPKYYRALLEAMRTAATPEPAWRPLAERGLAASIRESETESCEWFSTLLRSTHCGPGASHADTPSIVVPGGYRALLFVARGPEQSSPEAFLADYSRTLAANEATKQRKNESAQAYSDRLIEYFGLLADLETMGKRTSGKTAVRLSLENKNSSRVTERVLSLIGWRTRRASGKLVVEPVIKGKRAKHQDLASALAIDVVSMQERLQAGGEFVLEIADEPVEIFPAEKTWQDQFYAGERYPGGFLEAMVRKPAMAALYAALSNMEQGSAALLLRSVGMKPLAEKYSSLLTRYSSCLQISAGRVEVPGGNSAAPIWAALVRAQPTDPRRFLRELLDKDDGRLLKFYSLLSQLDVRRQRFFTANPKRTTAFYEVFRDSAQVEAKTARNVESASIEDLFRELPIDAEGHLEFPGAPEVWMVAKGKSNSVQTTDRRLKKLSRVTTPEVEDEILLHLIKSEYNQNHTRYGNWQNLLAVLRVDAVRTEPMDEASALLLAEKFSSAEGLYGYFTQLSGLEAKDYRGIFSFVEKMHGLDWKQANVSVGLFHAIFYLLANAEDDRRLKPPKAAALLGDFVQAMNQAQSPGQWAKASLDTLSKYLQALDARPDVSSLREFLVPVPKDWSFTLSDHTFTPGEDLRRSFDRVLELQNVPRLDELLRLHSALVTLVSGKGDPRSSAAAIIDITATFRDPEGPRQVKLPEGLAALLNSSQPARFVSLNRQLRKEAARKKPSDRFPKLAADYWDAVAFRTMIALAGQVYAANLRADDLVIAEDPWFLRKHRFVTSGVEGIAYFPPGALETSSQGAGSFATGGFDGIATIAGAADAAGLRNVDHNSDFVAGALLGSVRTTDWSRLTPRTLRAIAVQVHAAEDWLVMAADNPPVYDAVAASTYGLISLNRRARLLLALQRRDWDTVWSSLSLTDLFFLAARIRDASPPLTARSPAIGEYLSTAAIPEGVGVLGPTLPTLRRYAVPTLVELPPYEETAAEPHPVYLAERLAEFKLYLAYLFARESLPPEGLPAVAEIAARGVLEDIQMSDYRDWTAVIAAYAGFDRSRLEEVLGSK
jgi:tetratricopeptide (TPR) repeat protein